jgi:3-oxoacyl-[acyl-carrier-protein] synthase II
MPGLWVKQRGLQVSTHFAIPDPVSMKRQPRRVVVTGLGVISPVGIGTAAFWDALVSGRSGVRTIQSFDPTGLPTTMAGEVRDYDARKFVPTSQRKNLKIMARDIQLAVGAAKLALEDTGLLEQRPDPDRIGVEFGAGMICSELEDLGPSAHESVKREVNTERFDYQTWGQQAMGKMPPLWLLKYLPNMPACHISILYDLEGPNNSITQAEAASNLAIGEAFRIIARGSADVMLAGGCDSKINPLSMVKLCLLSVCSRRNDAPEQACRPFDAARDGMVPAEGAGVVILEELEHAQKRGAKIYGEIAGFGAGSDARPPGSTASDGSGYRVAVRAALREARMNPGEMGYYNAHGLSTREADRVEAQAISTIFGPATPEVPVSAHKSNFGNAPAACGLLEFIAGVLTLQHRLIPPTLNFTQPDPDCPLNVVSGRPRELQHGSFLSVNATRLGQAAAVVVRQFEGA